MVSPISYIGTVRISLHTVSVKYFVLPAHPISCWKTSIEVQRVTSVKVHSRKMHTGFIFATDTSARIGSLDCLCADKLSFCHLFHRFSVTMEPLYAFKASKHLLKNRSCHHQNANERFGLKHSLLVTIQRKNFSLLFLKLIWIIRIILTTNVLIIKIDG